MTHLRTQDQATDGSAAAVADRRRTVSLFVETSSDHVAAALAETLSTVAEAALQVADIGDTTVQMSVDGQAVEL